jgi:hypothetical protein
MTRQTKNVAAGERKPGASSAQIPSPIRQPDESETRAIAAAKQELAAMRPRLEAGTTLGVEGAVTQIDQGPSHSDPDGWRAQFKAAFGTTSEKVVSIEVERIARALRRKDGTIDPAELDAVIAIVSGQQPKHELEAMLICQVAVTHALAMRAAGNLNRSDQIPQQDSNALTFARLTKAFAGQVEALGKLRRGGEQRVLVKHEHVYVYPGAQAIVGAITHTAAPGGLLENRKQAHATESAIIAPSCEPVRSEDPERKSLPNPGCERSKAVPNARRGTRIRCTKR